MNRRIRTVLFAVIMLACLIGWFAWRMPRGWVAVTSKTEIFFDDVVDIAGLKTFWVRFQADDEDKRKWPGTVWRIARVEVNCNSRVARALEIDNFLADGSRRSKNDTEEVPTVDSTSTAVVPGTGGYKLMAAICRKWWQYAIP